MKKQKDQKGLAKPSLHQSAKIISNTQRYEVNTPSRHLLPILLISILSLIIYSNTLKNGFVYDDKYTIESNTLIRDSGNLSKLFSKDHYFALSGEQSYRPVVTLTYFLDFSLYGVKPWGFHLTNILLHAVNGVLLYILLALIQQSEIYGNQSALRSLFSNKPFLTSILFAAHPVLTEPVNAVSFREDLLAFLFYMATLCLYIFLARSKHKSLSYKLYYVTSYLTFFLALLSKEMAITLPLIIFCYEYYFSSKKGKDLYSIFFSRPFTGYLFVAIGYLCLRFFLFQNQYEVIRAWAFWNRLSTVPYLIMKYLYLMIAPFSLSADYVVLPIKFPSPVFIVYLLAVISLFALAFRLCRNNRETGFGAAFFILTLLPVYNIIPIVNPLAERYLYLPSVGFLMILTTILHRVFKTKSHYILLFILCLYSLAVINRNAAWNNNYTLWSDVIEKMPDSSRAHSELAGSYVEQKKWDAALKHLKIAVQINPSNAGLLNNMAIIYYEKGELDLALQCLKTSLKTRPGYAVTHNNIGNIYLKKNQFDDAIREFKMALELKGDYVQARYNIANAYFSKGLYYDAAVEYQKVLIYNPHEADVHFKLGSSYAEQGLTDKAIAEFIEALRLKPGDPQIQSSIDRTYKIKKERER